MNFICPACKSDNVQRLSIVHQGGLSNIKTKSRGSGIVIGGDGIGLGLGSSKTRGTTQTVASMRAAPPPKKHFLKPLGLITLACLFILALIAKDNSPIEQKMTGFVWAVATVGWIAFALHYNITKWPPLKAIWDNSCLCNRCDTIFYLGNA